MGPLKKYCFLYWLSQTNKDEAAPKLDMLKIINIYWID